MNNINYILEKTKKIYINNKEILNCSFVEYIEIILLDQLTTFDGRIRATKKKYNFYKLTPIFISHDICFIPINNTKDFERVYINIYTIIEMQKINKKTLIKFVDGTSVIIKKEFNCILNNYKRALIIKSL